MTTQTSIRPRPGILDIAPYVGGAATVEGANRSIKLSANENPFGPSERAIEAYRAHADKLGIYPETHVPLSRAIAEVHGLEADRIVLGNGSDELIALLTKAYTGPGDEVLFSAHGFLMYRLSAMAAARSSAIRATASSTDSSPTIAWLTRSTVMPNIARLPAYP